MWVGPVKGSNKVKSKPTKPKKRLTAKRRKQKYKGSTPAWKFKFAMNAMLLMNALLFGLFVATYVMKNSKVKNKTCPSINPPKIVPRLEPTELGDIRKSYQDAYVEALTDVPQSETKLIVENAKELLAFYAKDHDTRNCADNSPAFALLNPNICLNKSLNASLESRKLLSESRRMIWLLSG